MASCHGPLLPALAAHLIARLDAGRLSGGALDRRQHHQLAAVGVGGNHHAHPAQRAVVADAEVLVLPAVGA